MADNTNSESKKTKPSRSFPGQHAGEEVELVLHQHPIVMRKSLIFGLFGIVIGMLPLLAWSSTSLVTNNTFYDLSLKFALLTFVFVLAAWFYRWVGWYYSVYIVTDQRIVEVKQRGFFNRRVSEFGLDKIQNVNYHISGFQAVLFGFGDITVQTYVGDLVMSTVHKPEHTHEEIVEVVRRFSAGLPTGQAGSTRSGE